MTNALQDEIDARLEAMAATNDIPADERERTALEDIVDLSADDYGCYTTAERRSWNAIRKAARRRLASMGSIL